MHRICINHTNDVDGSNMFYVNTTVNYGNNTNSHNVTKDVNSINFDINNINVNYILNIYNTNTYMNEVDIISQYKLCNLI